MPAARIGQHRNCWQNRELFPQCKLANDDLRDGRDCCLRVEAGFKLAHNDLHNLVPSVGEIALRLEAVGCVPCKSRVPKAKGERPRRVYTITAKGRRAAIPDI